jgi:hypothetical protein
MSAVKKYQEDELPLEPPVDGYDLWRARRDLERYIFEHRIDDGAVAAELLRVRDFLRDLSGRD